MPRAGPRKVHRYTDEFKLTAVRLSQQPGCKCRLSPRRSRFTLLCSRSGERM